MSSTSRRVLALLFVLLWGLAARPGLAAEPIDYAGPGPFRAGWQQVTVSRPGGGAFTARLFYPATATGAGATYDASAAPYPAISFGHGFFTSRSYYQSTLEHLATWGYFVIATESEMGLFPNHSNYADDLRYCLTYLESANLNASSWLFGQVDAAHFGLSGHSMGGGASILAAARDERVDAVASLAAAETNPSAEAAMASVTVPVRLIVGSADGIVAPSTTLAMYDNGHPPRQFANIQGGWHCGFLDSSILFVCDSGPLARADQLRRTRRLLTEFFNLYLKGDQGPWRAVWGPEWDDDPQVVTARDAGLALAPDAQAGEAYLGGEASYLLTLTNGSPYATAYTLLAEENVWPVFFTPAVTPVLASGQAAAVQVVVRPPAGAAAGGDRALVSARSNRDGGTRHFAWIETQALAFTAGIARAGDALALTWTASSAACSYQVHRSTTPYFTPAPGTLIQTLPPGSSATTDETPGVVGDPAINYAYLVVAVCGSSAVDGGYLGEFDYSLVPGAVQEQDR